MTDTNTIMMMVQDKLPKDMTSLSNLRDRLDKLSDAKREELMQKLPMLNLKSPALVFWVGSFLFGSLGVGRFMIGDTLLGGIRLGLFILYLTSGFFAFISVTAGITISSIAVIAMWIWYIVDLFITGKKLRKKNLDKILLAIS